MTRIYLQETPQGWLICDASTEKILAQKLAYEDALKKVKEGNLELPAHIDGGPLLHDPDGKPLYWSKPYRGQEAYDLEYADGMVVLDIAPCPECFGVAFPKITEKGEKDCYVCTFCNTEVECVQDRAYIGELD